MTTQRPRLRAPGSDADAAERETVASASILPVHPVDVMGLEISGDGFLNCRKKARIADPCQQSESFQLVFHGILELGKA